MTALRFSAQGALVAAGAIVWSLAGALVGEESPKPKRPPGVERVVYPKPPKEMDALARSDGLALLEESLRWYERTVTDYTCTFTKQERIGETLAKIETTFLKFREKPFSAYLKWSEPSKGQEVIFVQGRYGGKAVVHQSGLLGLIFRKVSIDPEGKRAMRHSRRPITFAGLGNMLRLAIGQCKAAQAKGDLVLEYQGVREEAGRPAYVFNRLLPNGKGYPCHQLFILIDQEFLLPVRTEAYLWDGRLLSDYRYTDLNLNPGLTDEDFSPENREYGYRAF
ncbi:MAG TPA: DUF1571 domain-containing protein [Phycisphaerae bacterium]|nr:DUF1571 domain-containing protein [Phycisphaerae bacterium]